MRVALITGIFPPDIGGPATYIPALAAGLRDAGHRVEVVTYADAPRPRGEWPFRVTRILRGSLARRALAVLAIARAALRADVLLVNGLVEAATLANVVARRPYAVKIVGDSAWERARNRGLTTEEFAEFQQHAQPGVIARWQRQRTRCLRRATALITPSMFIRTVAEGWGIGRPVHVIPNGVDAEFVRAADAADLDALRAAHDVPSRFVLYAGRLTNFKGCDTLVRVLPELPHDVGLVLVGDGPERDALGALVERLDLSGRVRFLPPVDRATMAGLMRLAACFALNSCEVHPHVVLEAMAVGTPVAAASSCGTSELVRDGENGAAFDKNNEPQIIEALRRILTDEPARRRLVEGGLSTARECSWPATFSRTAEVLLELAGQRA